MAEDDNLTPRQKRRRRLVRHGRRQERKRQRRQGSERDQGSRTPQFGDNLPAPIRPVRGKEQIGRYVQSRVGREFNPVRQQIGRERRQVGRQRRQVNDLFRGYNQTIGNLAESERQTTNQAVGETQARLESAQERNPAFGEALAAQQAASAKLRGAPDQSGETREREQGAAAQRELNIADQAALMRAQGTNRLAQMQDNLRIGQGQRIQDQKRLMAAQRELGQDLRTLKRERGRFASEVLDDLRQREREFFIQNRAFGGDRADRLADLDFNQAMREQARLGLESAETTGESQRDVARIQGRNERERLERIRREQAERERAQERSGQREFRNEMRRGMAVLRKTGDPRHWRKTLENEQAIRDMLVTDFGLSPEAAKATVRRWIRLGRQGEAEAETRPVPPQFR